MKSSLFESQRALSVLAFLCEIRVWGLFWEPGGTSEQKLELNAIPGGTSADCALAHESAVTFVPKSKTPRTVSGRRREISVRSSPRMYTMDHSSADYLNRTRFSVF